MSFDTRVMAFAERFLSARTVSLVVAPAVADLHFEGRAGRVRQLASRFAVIKAVAGGVRHDLARAAGEMVSLALLSACYYIFLLVICFDVLSLEISTGFVVAAALILVLSFSPVIACFWPERPGTLAPDPPAEV